MESRWYHSSEQLGSCLVICWAVHTFYMIFLRAREQQRPASLGNFLEIMGINAHSWLKASVLGGMRGPCPLYV